MQLPSFCTTANGTNLSRPFSWKLLIPVQLIFIASFVVWYYSQSPPVPLIFVGPEITSTENTTHLEAFYLHYNQSDSYWYSEQVLEDVFGGQLMPPLYTDVLLVVHFNRALYQRMFLWKQFMHYFRHIVFTGLPVEGEEWPMDDPDFFVCPEAHGGHLAAHCLSLVMKDPRYSPNKLRGYFHVHFDAGIKPGLLTSFNLNTYWLAPSTDYPNITNIARKQWFWWGSKWGLPAVERFWKMIPDELVNKIAVKEFRRRGWISKGFADFVYVPSSQAHLFQEFEYYFTKAEVFLEIAYPMLKNMLNTTTTNLVGEIFTGNAICSLQMNPKATVVHRINWSNDQERKYFVHYHYGNLETWKPTNSTIRPSKCFIPNF